jgi:MFS family permease
MPQRDFYGWKLLSALWVVVFINLAFPIYGSSVANAVMMQDLKLDRQTLGFLFSLFTILSGLPGPLVAVSVGRFGVRRTLFTGSMLVVIGSVCMATVVRSGLQAALAFGVLVGTGVAAGGVIGAQASLARWFVRRRALALAIISSASGVGGFVAAPLINRIIAAAGGNWRMGWWLLAALSCIAAFVALVFVKERPEDLGQLPDGGLASESESLTRGRKWRGAVHITSENWTSRAALSGSCYWLLMFCQMGMSLGYTVFLAHGVMHLQDLGHSRDVGAWALSLMSLAGLFAKALVGALGDRLDPRFIWAGFIGIFGIGELLLVHADTHFLMVTASSCLGIGFGGGVVCLAAVISNYYGMKPFAVLIGVALAINTALGSTAPSLAGWLYDAGRGYQGVFYTIACWCFLGAMIMLLLKPPVLSQDNEAMAGL